MELEDLKKNWSVMEERLGRLEMENRKLLHRAVDSKVKQMRQRLLLRLTFIVFLLPMLLWQITRQNEFEFSPLTWGLVSLFLVTILIRQCTWAYLLNRIDCNRMAVREVCLAEARFRQSFKMGIAVSVLLAIPMLASMIGDMIRFGNPYIVYGAWTGLAIGLILGLRLFFRAWGGVKELREAIEELG
ncbi:hypothetical protein [Bacteroides sp.]|uniref:hypothetical protein n=1 Tax=Bacteroides sp. TaxID=29523 RepID=UPI0023D1F57D|nr:hypothetical protein [Bacteroides sp.]MDE6217305.1 hypothetical protein [Bacteroides sp.]